MKARLVFATLALVVGASACATETGGANGASPRPDAEPAERDSSPGAPPPPPSSNAGSGGAAGTDPRPDVAAPPLVDGGSPAVPTPSPDAGGPGPTADARPDAPPEPPPAPGDPSFQTVTPSATALGVYDTLTVAFLTTTPFANPFDQDDVKADLVATEPDGGKVVMPSFYRSGNSGSSNWEARFTPRKLGRHTFAIEMARGASVVRSSVYTLNVQASSLDGFLHMSPTSLYDLVFDSGKRFRGVGENFGWETDKYKFADMLPRLKGNKVNFVRTWEGPGRYALQHGQPLSRFDGALADRIDQVMKIAADNGIYLMSVLEPAIYYFTKPDYWDGVVRWVQNPFSTALAGPCARPTDFFTNETAKRHYRNKLRYAIARWGASPYLGVIELWNEYDHLVEGEGVTSTVIAAWHKEMSDYLKKVDPYGHIVTTSLSHNDYRDLWSLEGMAFTQRHLYGSTDGILGTHLTYETAYKKPFVAAEFSLDWHWPPTYTPAAYGREVHMGMWRGMFSPTPILPMTWWWDFHADNDQYFHFEHASTMAAKTAEGPGPLENQAITVTNGLEAMALKSPAGRFVWIHNKGTGTVNGASFTLTGMPDGVSFRVSSFNTWNGQWGTATSMQATAGGLRVALPAMTGDLDVGFWLAGSQ